MAGRTGIIPEDRPLTSAERELLTWLISNGTPEARNYIPQMEELRVISRCACGCPTVDFHPPVGPSQILADFYGVTSENVEVGVILHARDGRLSEMEVYSISQQDGLFGLPQINSLKKDWLPSNSK
jgi:hypothetical protein